MDDKYILMKTDDPRSKKIAEALSNKTCKKIIDFLSDNDEASEKDLADALDMKINKIEYNLKKLIEGGLVKKSKNFFWSKKGRRITMFKLAKKHIIISPKNITPDLNLLKGILPVAIIIGLIAIFLATFLSTNQLFTKLAETSFYSLDELDNFIADNNLINTNEMQDASFGGMSKSESNLETLSVNKLSELTENASEFYIEEDNLYIFTENYDAAYNCLKTNCDDKYEEPIILIYDIEDEENIQLIEMIYISN